MHDMVCLIHFFFVDSFWTLVANLSSTSASCLGSLLMVEFCSESRDFTGVWVSNFFFLQVCNYLPFRNSSCPKGKFWTTDPNPIPKSHVDLLHIPIYFWCKF